MNKWILILLLPVIGFLPGMLFPVNFNVTKVGEWGSGYYRNVFVQGNYAYCTAGSAGLDIIDISNPSYPKKIWNYEKISPEILTENFVVRDVYVKGNYAYVLDNNGLNILDVTNPSAPTPVGHYDQLNAEVVYVKGNYAYVGIKEYGLQIFDVSNPSDPKALGIYEIIKDTSWGFADVKVCGNYAYIVVHNHYFIDNLNDLIPGELQIVDVSDPTSLTFIGTYYYEAWVGPEEIDVKDSIVYAAFSFSGFKVIDVSNPSAPTVVGTYENCRGRGIEIRGNYAFLACSLNGLQVVDISTPFAPTPVGNYSTPGYAEKISLNGNYAYVTEGYEGLEVIDISNPSSPTYVGAYDESGWPRNVFVSGNYAYVIDYREGLKIIDVANPSSPVEIGNVDTSTREIYVYVSGNYAYVVSSDTLYIFDVSDPFNPIQKCEYTNLWSPYEVYVSGNYVYVADGSQGLKILDVSDPTSPTPVGSFEPPQWRKSRNVFVSGHYAYVTSDYSGLYSMLQIIDVSNPSHPSLVGEWGGSLENDGNDVYVKGNYAYVVDNFALHIIDVTEPSSPAQVGEYRRISSFANGVHVSGNYAFLAEYRGLEVISISPQSSPTSVGYFAYPFSWGNVFVNGDYAYVAHENGKLYIFYFQQSRAPTQISLDRTSLTFAAIDSSTTTSSQFFLVTNSGGGTLNWWVSDDQYWIDCSPTFGTNNGEITVSVDITGLSPGTYTGTVTVSAPDVTNSPQTLEVTLTIYTTNQTSGPFGTFATPVNGSVVRSSIPVTGWALDDIGVKNVQIFREQESFLVYIGDAVFVEGARPDVEQAYPTYPNSYKAGWGYMMLTNFLPDGGNGTFKLHAVATDLEGNQVTLGTKTIICDNANAVKPFGAIDTPTQGGTASGSNFVNFGWVLTPLPNTIPTDGSTIRVWVDGVSIGNPVYNQYRKDIATLFPGYNNSNGAVGYFSMNTGHYENGMHTIQWTAVDDAGNTDGIGSRYFSIQNTGESRAQRTASRAGGIEGRDDSLWSPGFHGTPVKIIKGYSRNVEPQPVYPNEKGIFTVEIKELERLEIHFFAPENSALNEPVEHRILDLSPLPIGSTLDRERGIFYWNPGPGFIGEYRFVFGSESQHGHKIKKEVRVIIRPKF